ncbi:MAG: ribonuclease HI [Thermofilaceae archaeon]
MALKVERNPVKIIVYFDGLCEPVNPGGIATYGFTIYRGDSLMHSEGGFVGAGYLGDDVTNNVAEYMALIKALEWLLENGYSDEELVVRGDSQLTISQLKGEYSVHSQRIAPLYHRTVTLINRFRNVRFEWVPRSGNKEADSLSRQAYFAFIREHPETLEKYAVTPGKRSWVRKHLYRTGD